MRGASCQPQANFQNLVMMHVIWTHRGRPHAEHSIEAFAKAAEAGVLHFEVDVRLTVDGRVVLVHDSTTTRITGKTGKISELTWDELQSRKIENQFSWVTLEDFLSNFTEATISIDFKSPDVVGPSIEILKNFPNSKLILGSFSGKRVKRLMKALPHHNFALAPLEILLLTLGIKPPGIDSHNRYAMVPEKYFGIKVLTKAFINTCQRLSVPIHVWVINDPKKATELISRGVSGIVTDDYPAMITHLRD